MTSASYKQYKFREYMKLLRYVITLGALVLVLILAPNDAAKIVSYLGAFLFGGTKLGQTLKL